MVQSSFKHFTERPPLGVLYVFLMKDIDRCLPWMLSVSTGRFSTTLVFCAPILAKAVYSIRRIAEANAFRVNNFRGHVFG